MEIKTAHRLTFRGADIPNASEELTRLEWQSKPDSKGFQIAPDWITETPTYAGAIGLGILEVGAEALPVPDEALKPEQAPTQPTTEELSLEELEHLTKPEQE